MAEDYYKTLGVERSASKDEILKAYRTLARKYHPDLNPDDEQAQARFKTIQAAYDVLNDPEKRKLYDRYGATFEQYASAGGAAGPGGFRYQTGGNGEGAADFSQFADFFSQAYGGAGAETEPFAEIFERFRRAHTGPGAGAGPEFWPGHGGRPGRTTRAGRTRARRAAPVDVEHEISIPFTIAIAGGETRVGVERSDGHTDLIDVRIPPGTRDGQKLRLRGQGEALPGQAPGDLLLSVRVQPHRWFTRQDNDLHVKVPVSLGEAALGAKIEVPTPGGTALITIPPSTSGGTKLRIKGQGVPAFGTREAGDLFVEIQIKLPRHFDDDAREALRQIERRHPIQPRTELDW